METLLNANTLAVAKTKILDINAPANGTLPANPVIPVIPVSNLSQILLPHKEFLS
jgi:hypothetical protein